MSELGVILYNFRGNTVLSVIFLPIGLEGGSLVDERSRSSRLVRELREREGEEVSPESFWGVWVPPTGGAVGPGGGEEGTDGMGLGLMVVAERGRI